MCNCMQEKTEIMKEVCGFDYVLPPVEMLSGKCYITFAVHEPGKKRSEVSMLLSRCPLCGEPYDTELSEAGQESGQDAAVPRLMPAT